MTAVAADYEFACWGNLVAIETSRMGRMNSQYGKQDLS